MRSARSLDGMNEAQRAAATHAGGHVLVLAGAGSGKTRTIIARATCLIDSGTTADRIQILTFTRKSAAEIVGRVKMLLGEEAAQLSACTFHSWCMRLIRRMPGMFGCEGNSVIDREDQLNLFKVVRGRELSALPPAAELCDIYSYARNCRVNLTTSLNHFDRELLRLQDSISRVFTAYEARKKTGKYLDYDDVIDVVATVLRADEDVRTFVATRYDHLLVDEMQDTNPLQWQLLDAVREHVKLYCVGDDAQSIYGFRGADFRNVHSFKERVPGAAVLKLEENYRSTQPILDLANWLLRQSPLAYDKDLVAVRVDGRLPKLVDTDSEWDEGQWIANDILGRRGAGAVWKDHMVLIRSRYAGRATEVALLAQNIPFVFIGGMSLLQAAHVRDVLALLRIVANPSDEIAWVRYLTLWPRVGDVTASELVGQLADVTDVTHCASVLAEDPRMPAAAFDLIITVARLASSPAQAFKAAASGLAEVLEANYRNQQWAARARDFPYVEKLAANHGSLLAFIEQYVLDPVHASELDQLKRDDCVTLITIHSAKGTEAPVCYIPGVSPGAYPLTRCIGDLDEVEEERRVLYVAITRARDELILTRTHHARYAAQPQAPQADDKVPPCTYFLNDLPYALVETVATARRRELEQIRSAVRPRPNVGIDLT